MKKIIGNLDFESICDDIEPLIYIADPDTYQVLYVNDTAKKLFKGDLVGEKCYIVFQGLDAPCEFCTNDQLFGENPQSPIKWEFYNKNIKKWFKIIDQRIKADDKYVRFEMAIDITKQKESEQKYKESKEQIEKILESLKDPIIIISNQHKILYANQNAKQIFGKKIKNRSCFELLRNQKEVCEKCPMNFVFNDENCKLRLEKEIYVEEKETFRIFDVVISPIKIYDDKQAVLESFRDITQKEDLIKEIEKSEQKYKALIENLDEAIYRMNLKTGEYEYFSPSVKKIFGFTAKQFYENPMLIEKLIHPDFLDYFYEKWKDLMDGIVEPSYEFKIIDKNNNEIWIRQSNAGIYDDEGKLIAIEGICKDVTQNKRKERRDEEFKAKLKMKVKEKTHQIQERVKELSCLYDISKLIANTDISFDNTIKKIVSRIPKSMQYPEKTKVSIEINNKEYLSDNFQTSIWLLKEELENNDENVGKIAVYYTEPKPNLDEGPFLKEERALIKGIKKNLENYIERKELEKKVKKNEKLFNIIASNLPKGLIHIFDTDLKYVYNAGKELEKLGLSNELLVGKTIYDVLDPKIAETVAQKCKLCIKKKRTISFEGDYGKNTYMVNVIPVLDPKGEVEYILALSVNVTRMKKREEKLKELTQRLQMSNADLEQFAYVASHDLQEPLRTISSFTQILTKIYREKIGPLDDKYERYINHIINGTKRMKSLINDLLAYSRVESRGNQFKLFNTESVLIAVLNSLKKSIESNNVKISYAELPKIIGDKSQIFQVLQNLISNAIKFKREETQPEIEISASEEEHRYIFSVSDNGIGIANQYHSKIFNIFQRLHSSKDYSGSGIGLSLCKKIINRHGGEIWVKSEKDVGSTFFFSIPKKPTNHEI